MLKYIVIFLGTQAIEAILVALHRYSTDGHQEAEVPPGFPLESLSIGLFVLNVSSYVQSSSASICSFYDI